MHDLIMRQGQDEIFVEGLEEAKRQRIMVELTMDGIVVHVLQHIVHPAHIPFQPKPEATDVCRWSRVWAEMGYGLDARYAGVHAPRSHPS